MRHPLQPFDAAQLHPGELAGRPFSFDRAELAGAPAAAGPTGRAAAVPARPAAPGPRRGTVAARRAGHLPRAPGQGLPHASGSGCRCPPGDEAPADALPVELDGLATWAIGDRLLRDRLAGPASSTAAGRPSGGAASCRRARWAIALLDRRARRRRAAGGGGRAVRGEPRPDATGRRTWSCPTATRVGCGTVGGLHRAHRLLRVEYSRLAPKQRIRAWVRLLALTAADRRPWVAVTIGRGARFGIAQGRLGPVEPDRGPGAARRAGGAAGGGAVRAAAAAHRRRAHLRPGPARRSGAERGAGRGRRAWTIGAGAERADAAHVRVWGRAAGPRGALRRGGAAGRRAHPVRRARPGPVVTAAAGGGRGATVSTPFSRPPRSTSAGRCPPAPPCWRPARAPARRSPSPRWPPATSPRAGRTLPELMLVTFGREATNELRERVRERLVSTERARSPTRPRPAPVRDDGARAARRRAGDAEVALRRARLDPRARPVRRRHHRHHPPVLPADAGRARRGRRTPTRTRVFVESVDDLLTEVVDDFYVRKYGDRGARAAGVRAAPRRWSSPGAPSTTGRPGWSRPTPTPGSTADVRRPVRRGRAGRGRPAQAGPAALHLRRHAHPARRRAGRPGARRGAAPAGPLPGGAGRRVPGHRPGAVVHPAARLPRRTSRWC